MQNFPDLFGFGTVPVRISPRRAFQGKHRNNGAELLNKYRWEMVVSSANDTRKTGYLHAEERTALLSYIIPKN